MIDLHVHWLPGLDDGAQDEEEFFCMAETAVREGIQTIVGTPHHLNGVYVNPAEKVLEAEKRARFLLSERGIPLQVRAAQEVHLSSELFSALANDEILFLDGRKGRYLLLELPRHVPPDVDRWIYELRIRGIVPVLAHVERYALFREHPQRLFTLVEKGAVLQVTAGSFTGAFGEDVRTFAVRLAENGWVHLVASDAHRASGRRGFHLREAYRILERILGTEEVLAIHSRAEGILDGREISAEEGEPFPPVGKKGVFFARLKNLFGYNQ
ncbi:MAG: phosphotransferase [Brockia lithotrophica]|nr:phosphotransferase [Brockia lithotrophica]